MRAPTNFFTDKLIALDRVKAEFCYHVCRALQARRVVEAGTSFGVSTIFLAAAVRDNLRREVQSPSRSSRSGVVIRHRVPSPERPGSLVSILPNPVWPTSLTSAKEICEKPWWMSKGRLTSC